jgi:hypothetical protein
MFLEAPTGLLKRQKSLGGVGGDEGVENDHVGGIRSLFFKEERAFRVSLDRSVNAIRVEI